MLFIKKIYIQTSISIAKYNISDYSELFSFRFEDRNQIFFFFFFFFERKATAKVDFVLERQELRESFQIEHRDGHPEPIQIGLSFLATRDDPCPRQ